MMQWVPEGLCSRPYHVSVALFFFFKAEDGIRDKLVTGVQTCALPISRRTRHGRAARSQLVDVPDRGSRRLRGGLSRRRQSHVERRSLLRPRRRAERGRRRLHRSGGRRVGEEGWSWGWADHLKKKKNKL